MTQFQDPHEIVARLFIGHNTVAYHLGKMFATLIYEIDNRILRSRTILQVRLWSCGNDPASETVLTSVNAGFRYVKGAKVRK